MDERFSGKEKCIRKSSKRQEEKCQPPKGCLLRMYELSELGTNGNDAKQKKKKKKEKRK